MTTTLRVARPAAGAGLAWLKAGWGWFSPAAIAWMGMTAMVFLLLLGAALIPHLGGRLVELLSPFLVAGYMAAARAAERGEPITFLHLGSGFTGPQRIGLAIIGGIYLAGLLLIDLVIRQMGGEGMQQLAVLAANQAEVDPQQMQTIVSQALPAILVGLLLLVPLVMATWFAPALVLFDGFSAANAMWWSLWACTVNWRPLLLYSLLVGVIGVAAMLIPLGLGLLAFLPVALCSTYAAYRAIFLAGDAA
ncbi:MAG: BPSS1780 family membrane protein [Gallionellaceae bacterium]|nr:BPSS1780 family membrane protein [Gallionellaceae bacterium]